MKCNKAFRIKKVDQISHLEKRSYFAMRNASSQSESVTNCKNCVLSDCDVIEFHMIDERDSVIDHSINESLEKTMSTKLEVSIDMFNELAAKVAKLEEQINKSRGTASTREMTDDDARRVLNGDLKSASHKAAAETLGLSYGQVYSCRGEYTFKHILKALKSEGWKNPFVK